MGDDVGSDGKAGPAERGEWNDNPVHRRSFHPPYDVWRHYAHEAYRPAECGNGAGKKRTSRHYKKAQPPEPEPGKRSELITEQDQIQSLSNAYCNPKADEKSRPHDDETGTANASETAGHPAVKQLEALFRC